MQKAKRVRATLVELKGVRDVFVDKEIGFHVDKGVTLDSKRLNQLLQKEGVVVEKISRGEGYIL